MVGYFASFALPVTRRAALALGALTFSASLAAAAAAMKI